MAQQYQAGWITVPGRGRRWRDEKGNYSYERPGWGRQMLGEIFYNDEYTQDINTQAREAAARRQGGGENLDDEFNPNMSLREKGGLPSETRMVDGVAVDVPPSTPAGGAENPAAQGQTPAPTPEVQTPDTRVSPTGVVQQGRNLSLRLPTMEEVNAYAGRPVANAFSSIELPTQNENLTPEQQAVAGFEMGQDLAGGTAAELPNGLTPADAFNAGSGMGADLAADLPGTPTATEQSRRESANAAFRTANNTIDGLKGREAELGLVYASGKYWVKNPNAGEDGAPALLAVSGSEPGGENRDAVRQYKDGAIDAQSFFDNYVKGVQESTPATADTENTASDPLDAAPDPEDQRVPGRNVQPGGGFGPSVVDTEVTPPVTTDQSGNQGEDDEQGQTQLRIR